MPLLPNLNAIIRHPLKRDKRREFRRNHGHSERKQLEAAWEAERKQLEAAWEAERKQLEAAWEAERKQLEATRQEYLEEMMEQLYVANSALQRAVARNDELIREALSSRC
jgi:flagellar biosynthesis/type III secretory pathway protein FliH